MTRCFRGDHQVSFRYHDGLDWLLFTLGGPPAAGCQDIVSILDVQ